MPARYFTVEEANSLLPKINAIMADLMEHRSRVVNDREEMGALMTKNRSDFGGGLATRMVQDFIAIEKLAKKIHSTGCIIKDLNAGLLDFLSEKDGREIYLCWKFGEPQVEYYHELHTGFQGRRRI